MAYLNVGDIVSYTGNDKRLMGRRIYTVSRIDRGIDGAYDWDDIYLEGREGKFCEFDFNKLPD